MLLSLILQGLQQSPQIKLNPRELLNHR